MPYNSSTSAYERRAATVIDATPDGDTVAVAIDVKLDQGIDDYVSDLNHHNVNGNHHPATSAGSDSRFLKQSPAGVVSWANGVVAADAALKDFSNVASGAIAPAKVAQDASNRFVTDAEKTAWDGALYDKADVEGVLTGADITSHGHASEVAPCLSSARYLHVRDEKPSGTGGGTSSNTTWHTRDLNTVKTNTISGASVASNRITLPAGTYYLRASAPGYACSQHKIKIRNYTDSSDVSVGSSEFATNADGQLANTRSFVTFTFTLASSKAIELQHYITVGVASFGLGVNTSVAGHVEVYSEVEIWKI